MPSEAAAAFKGLLDARYSCRGYRADPVPHETIEAILAAAQRTASWCNAQPWQLTITSGAATEAFRDALLAHVDGGAEPSPDIPFPAAYTGQYLARRRECGLQLYDAVGVPKGDRAASAAQARENFRLFGAPHVAIVTSEADLGTYGVADCGAYVGNFMLAARAHGVASIAQAALALHGGFVRRHFDIPDNRWMVCAISFGFEDPGHVANGFRTTRAEPEAVVDYRR